MAAKLLHSLTDDNPDLQKQIGCMTGIFQMFDRQHMLTGGRRIVGHSPKRLPSGKDFCIWFTANNLNFGTSIVYSDSSLGDTMSMIIGNSQFNRDTLERESNTLPLRSASVEYSHKNVQDRQRVSTESSRASFSSSSRSSSFSSLDCNKGTTQLEPASFDRMIFPENPPRDPAMNQQNTSPQFTRQTVDLRDLVKDSIYREVLGVSIKAKTLEEAAVPYRDSPRLQSKASDGSCGSGLDKKQSTAADLRESLRLLAKLQEAPRYHNEPRELMRSSSYHSKDGSSFSISKDAPRFSYDGREMNRTTLDSRDGSNSALKLKDLPRLSLDSREGSMRSVNADSKSNLKSMPKGNGAFDGKVQSQQQTPGNPARPPSVVAKLMGLEMLPDSFPSSDANMGSTRSYPDADFVERRDPSKIIQISSSSKSSSKEPSSPHWRNSDSSMKPMSRFPIEPAPWKQIDGSRGSQKAASRSSRGPSKAPTAFPSVYSEIEKRLKDIEFTQSGKDLRALKQILEAMQAKGLLETPKEEQGSNFTSHKDREQNILTSTKKSVDDQKPQTDEVLASSKRKTGSARTYESPIVIMKPAKLVEKSRLPAASVISLDGLSRPPKIRSSESTDDSKVQSSVGTSKDLRFKSSQRDNVLNSANTKNDKTLKTTQISSRSQHLTKEGNAGSGKSSGSISPRIQQKKLEAERRSRPPTAPDSSKLKRQSNKPQGESNSPGGRRRPKYTNYQQSEDQLSEVSVESRNLSSHENEDSAQINETPLLGSSNAEVSSSERSPGASSIQSPSMKTSEFMLSGSVEKKSTLVLSEEESAELGFVPIEYSSPVSVLDNVVYKHDSPPTEYAGKPFKVDASTGNERNPTAAQESSVDVFDPNSTKSGATFEINRKKLQNIENLVQKLRRLNSNHDEARTDYIASLCENTDPDHRYVSEILLTSGLLLRDLSSSLSDFQFHPSGHPINPELFLVLEQTKGSTLLKEECGLKKTAQLTTSEKFHRKLIFDTVNEILARKLVEGGPHSEAWSRPRKLARTALNAQKLLKELCSEIEELGAKNPKCSSDEEDDGWKNILCKDVMHRSESWIDYDADISGAVLDIERLIFKDLVDEVVIGESAGLITKPGRRKLFAK
ncbi:UNVERIFIED_CONTAM: protein LONGIFOLIA 1 [Sesamum latifolium]|uniref:Protein LONGIFOLIA 1 n=1 Tax=Sesamum latifolium TaxID=2727402 RepID=A0AAW2V3H4_9LAMI